MSRSPIGLTPFHSVRGERSLVAADRGESPVLLRGVLISGRWPGGTLEWTQLLVAALRFAAVPGVLPYTTVFTVVEDRPEGASDDTVGMLFAVGGLDGDDTVHPGMLDTVPPALAVMHPPSQTRVPVPELDAVASGCVLLPGAPDLGLDHRAGWGLAASDGTVVEMRSAVNVDPGADPDTAVLSLLIAS